MKMQGNPPDWARYSGPDEHGHFGPYGGIFVAETLRGALDELTLAYSACREDARKSPSWCGHAAPFVRTHGT